MLFLRCFFNVETTPTNMSRLNFQFQPNFNVETTLAFLMLNQRNSINLASTLFCQCWMKVDKCTLPKLSFSTKYQRWSNIDERWQSTLFQRSLIQRWCVCWVRNLKKSIGWTINNFRLNNSLAINCTILRFSYRKKDVQRRRFSNFQNFSCRYHQIIAV